MLKRYQDERLAVIDLGTNAIRLNVYEGYVCIYQEKNYTALGAALPSSNRLSYKGKDLVCQKLKHYKKILSSLEVDRSIILATEALRSAVDAPHFIRKIEKIIDVPLLILSGEEEARYLAASVATAFDNPAGMVVDCGGGSVEMAKIRGGEALSARSFPFGVARMRSVLPRMRDPWAYFASVLQDNNWINGLTANEDLYVSGGTWRALGQLFMLQADYPLLWVHNYRPDLAEFKAFLMTVAQLDLSTISLSRIRNQRHMLPTSAVLLRGILDVLQPRSITFSAYGLREGYLSTLLHGGIQNFNPMGWKEDEAPGKAINVTQTPINKVGYQRDTPLLSYARFEARKSDKATCRSLPPLLKSHSIALNAPRGEGQLLNDGTSGVYLPEALLLAAYLLSGMENPAPQPFKAGHAFLRVLELPLVGINHKQFVWLAVAVASYFGNFSPEGQRRKLIDHFLTHQDIEKAQSFANAIHRCEESITQAV